MAEIVPKRGEIYSVDFGGITTAEIGKVRPALIIQNNIGNQHSPTTIVAAIHQVDETKELPVCVLIKRGVGGLTKDSVIDTGHLLTLDKKRLDKKWGEIPFRIQQEVDKALKASLDLS
ncbi:MAG: type II toxin-antitoxin system PemK/MazF family toxin [Candidatus Omnitrophica bacterium]|nr:type II toxin-antitoxin system PemK/MazF family toxin [Candidatus Omnitrophota bacterium]